MVTWCYIFDRPNCDGHRTIVMYSSYNTKIRWPNVTLRGMRIDAHISFPAIFFRFA